MTDDARALDPNAALNRVLSEVIDLVQDVKQAHRKVPETHSLHTELDRLFGGLVSWAQLLMGRDEALGVSAMESMATVAGRKAPNLWPGAASDNEVRQLVGEHLARLGRHVLAAQAVQNEDDSRIVLATIERELLAHRQALTGPT